MYYFSGMVCDGTSICFMIVIILVVVVVVVVVMKLYFYENCHNSNGKMFNFLL